MSDETTRNAALRRDLTLGELLAVIASEASEHPYVGSAKQKAAWDEIKERFAALEKAEAPASDREMSRASGPPQSHAAPMRRIVVTHTASYVFDQEALDKAWRDGPALPNYITRPGEEDDPDARAMTMYEAYGDSIVELFHPLQDDDTGYEVEDYDPEA